MLLGNGEGSMHPILPFSFRTRRFQESVDVPFILQKSVGSMVSRIQILQTGFQHFRAPLDSDRGTATGFAEACSLRRRALDSVKASGTTWLTHASTFNRLKPSSPFPTLPTLLASVSMLRKRELSKEGPWRELERAWWRCQGARG